MKLKITYAEAKTCTFGDLVNGDFFCPKSATSLEGALFRRVIQPNIGFNVGFSGSMKMNDGSINQSFVSENLVQRIFCELTATRISP